MSKASQLLCLPQTDLRVETVHLRRFYNNFASVRSSVTPPLPVPGMDTEAVLVETYEAGEHDRLDMPFGKLCVPEEKVASMLSSVTCPARH